MESCQRRFARRTFGHGRSYFRRRPEIYKPWTCRPQTSPVPADEIRSKLVFTAQDFRTSRRYFTVDPTICLRSDAAACASRTVLVFLNRQSSISRLVLRTAWSLAGCPPGNADSGNIFVKAILGPPQATAWRCPRPIPSHPSTTGMFTTWAVDQQSIALSYGVTPALNRLEKVVLVRFRLSEARFEYWTKP